MKWLLIRADILLITLHQFIKQLNHSSTHIPFQFDFKAIKIIIYLISTTLYITSSSLGEKVLKDGLVMGGW